MRPRYAGRFIRGGSHVAHADDAVQGDSSPTGAGGFLAGGKCLPVLLSDAAAFADRLLILPPRTQRRSIDRVDRLAR